MRYPSAEGLRERPGCGHFVKEFRGWVCPLVSSVGDDVRNRTSTFRLSVRQGKLKSRRNIVRMRSGDRW